jgi:hypothetical protein
MSSPITLIACGIFQEEVLNVLHEIKAAPEILWLEVGLHDNIEKMEEILAETAAKARAGGAADIGLLYGMACLPTMKDFAAAHNLKVLKPRNCLAAMVGDEKLKELEKDRTLVATPGWVRKMWLGRASDGSGWQADDFRMHAGRYDRILVLDAGLSPLSDEEIITCFDLVQVPIEVMECSLDYFRGVFRELIEE